MADDALELDIDETLREIAEFESTALIFCQELKEHPILAESASSLLQEIAQGLAFLRSRVYQSVGIESDYTQ